MRKWDVLCTLGGETHRPRALWVREAASEPTCARLELRSPQPLDLAGALDSMASVAFLADGVPERTMRLRVRAARHLGVRDGLEAYEVELRSSIAFTALIRGVRKFRDISADQIVRNLLADAGVEAHFALAAPLPDLPYSVQYRETTYDFVHRLMEHEGVHYTIEDDDSVRFSDDSRASSDVDGVSVFGLTSGEGALSSDGPTIHAFARGAQVGTDVVTVNDYNWRTPQSSLAASAVDRQNGDRVGQLERYEYLTGYRDPAAGKRLAQLRLEAATWDKRFAEGKGTAVHFRPMRTFGFEHDDGLSFSGTYLLVTVEHRYSFGAQGGRYENDFHAIPTDVRYRPPVVTPAPIIGGTHTARVVGPPGEEIHTDAYGRFKARFHWDREAKNTDEDSRWLRMLQETSSSIALARVGWEVVVGYIGGDPSRPVGLGRLINGQMVPTYAQPAHQNVMTIKTESYPTKAGANEIRLDDTSGAQQIFIKAEHQLVSNVKHDQRETVGRDETHDVKVSLSRATGRDQRYAVGHDLVVNVGATDQLNVRHDRRRTVGASEKVDIEGTLMTTVQANDHEKVGSVRVSLVGGLSAPPKPSVEDSFGSIKSSIKSALPKPKQALSTLASGGKLPSPGAALKSALPSPGSLAAKAKSMLDPSTLIQGSIVRSAKQLFTRKVGAAHVSVAGGAITRSVDKFLSETIGAVRLTKTQDQSIAEMVGETFARTVLGNAVFKAGANFGLSAKTISSNVAGDATYTARQHGSVRSDDLVVEARDRVRIEVGELSIEMTPGAIRLAGDLRLIAKDAVTVGGGPDDITE
ncbi:MAG: type VI secretion system tip protein TssI/VgrG [Polyangiaceae bacterium]